MMVTGKHFTSMFQQQVYNNQYGIITIKRAENGKDKRRKRNNTGLLAKWIST